VILPEESGRKVMLYNLATGKELTAIYPHNWVHKLINQPDYYLKQCFFGELLLINTPNRLHWLKVKKRQSSQVNTSHVLWLATVDRMKRWTSPEVLKYEGHQVVLWPDIQSYDDWSTKGNY
jgi:hypothetical protein